MGYPRLGKDAANIACRPSAPPPALSSDACRSRAGHKTRARDVRIKTLLASTYREWNLLTQFSSVGTAHPGPTARPPTTSASFEVVRHDPLPDSDIANWRIRAGMSFSHVARSAWSACELLRHCGQVLVLFDAFDELADRGCRRAQSPFSPDDSSTALCECSRGPHNLLSHKSDTVPVYGCTMTVLGVWRTKARQQCPRASPPTCV